MSVKGGTFAVVTFILAVNFMWVTPSGQQEVRPMSGEYTSHAECVQAMKSKGDAIRITNGGIQPVPIGTDLCRAVEQPDPKTMSPAAADAMKRAMKAAQDAANATQAKQDAEERKREAVKKPVPAK